VLAVSRRKLGYAGWWVLGRLVARIQAIQARQMQHTCDWLLASGIQPGSCGANTICEPGSGDAEFFLVSPGPGWLRAGRCVWVRVQREKS
jgi:hypothetical protein